MCVFMCACMRVILLLAFKQYYSHINLEVDTRIDQLFETDSLFI